MNVGNIRQSITNTVAKIKNYTEPRSDTLDSSLVSTAYDGATFGGVRGYYCGGPLACLSGMVGGFIGGKLAEKDKSFGKALTVGAVTGALTALGVASIAAFFGSPLSIPFIVSGGIVGGLSGAAGTVSVNRQSKIRDGLFGGLLMGIAASALTGNSALAVASAVAGGVGAKGKNFVKRFLLGAAAGTATGTVSGILGNFTTIAAGAASGAVAGGVGAVLGPIIRQIINNGLEDLKNAAIKVGKPILNKVTKKIKPFLSQFISVKNIQKKIKDGKFTDKLKIGYEAVSNAVDVAPLGLLYGASAIIGVSAIGAMMGGISAYQKLKYKAKDTQKQE